MNMDGELEIIKKVMWDMSRDIRGKPCKAVWAIWALVGDYNVPRIVAQTGEDQLQYQIDKIVLLLK